MDIEISRHLGAVHRTVNVDQAGQRDTRVVRLSRTYATPVEDLWEACTDPERIPRWVLPITGDLRLGGRYQLEGNAGGEILECEPPRHLVVTWEFGDSVSRVEVDLTSSAEGTALDLRHIVEPDRHWKEFGPGAVGVGWELSLLGLDEHLTSGRDKDPAASEAWARSSAGR